MISRKSILAISACGLLAMGIAACGGDDDGGGSSDLSGTIAIDGSSTVFPFAQAAAEAFNGDNPDVRITVGESGTGGGFEKFCAGETQISDASRPIEAEEVDACKKGNISYEEIQVANDGISITTSPDLEISCLSTDQLKQLWNKGSQVSSYSDLGQDAETNQALPDEEVTLYGPGTDSGTFDFFTEEINGEEGVSRDDYEPSEDDNVLVEGVSGDQDGLGYFGFSYYEQNADASTWSPSTTARAVSPRAPRRSRTASYTPLSRPLFMYPERRGAAAPEVKAFMQYILDNYDTIAETAQLVGMDSAGSEGSAAFAKVDRLGGAKGERPRVEAGTRSRRGGAGDSGPRRHQPALGREGDPGRPFSRSGDLDPDHPRDRRPLLNETIKFFQDVGVGAFLFDADW